MGGPVRARPGGTVTPDEVARVVLELERPLLIGLDVDGTLAPIVTDPTAAEVPVTTLRSLERIAEHASVALAFLSGRDSTALRRLVPLSGVWLAPEHGATVIAPDQTETDPSLADDRAEALSAFADWAHRHAQDAYVETKPRSVAVHVRKLALKEPEAAAGVLAKAQRQAMRLGLEPRKGRAVLEACAVAADKGPALREIAERSKCKSVFYAGDDLTDFAAIAFAEERGIGVFVQSRERTSPPQASGTLPGTESVAEFLSRVAQELS